MGAAERGGGELKLRANNQSLKGENATVVETLHQLIMYILSDVQPVKKYRYVRSEGGKFGHIEILHHERRAPELFSFRPTSRQFFEFRASRQGGDT